MIDDRVLLHLADGRRPPHDPREIFFVEADGGDSLVRLRGQRRLRDVRELGELEELLAPYGFLRIHRDTLVNLRRVRDVRPMKAKSRMAVESYPGAEAEAATQRVDDPARELSSQPRLGPIGG